MHLLNNILLFIILKLDISLALRDVRVQIPHAVRKGEKAILNCLYDLEGDSLYSVKWYKGRREFYSFTPKENPAMKVFQFAGVKVDRSSSNESQLVLENVNAATSGKYSCEVSADAPSFHTLIGADELEVVVPGKDPVITGIRSRYKVGDIVRGNCTSSHSRPAANITWTVNGYETNPAHIRHFKPHKDPRELETVISAIHFVVTPQHFIYGKLKLRCTAFIHDVYWKSTEKSIEESRLQRAGTSNVVHKFSEDYFDLDEENVVDRSDTYMTHIKGDVSSLNASSSSALNKSSGFWPCLTTLSLVFYALQQMFQLLQELLSQARKNKPKKAKQNGNNFQTLTTNLSANMARGTNLFKIKAAIETLKQKRAHFYTKTSLGVKESTICYKNKSSQAYWPKENYFQIKLIKEKHQQQQHQFQIVEEKQRKLQFDCINTPALAHDFSKQLHAETSQSQLQLRLQLLQDCEKTPFKNKSNLTMAATQVSNIFTANTAAFAILLNIQRYIYNKVCNNQSNLYALFCTAPPKSCSYSLNSDTRLNFRAINVSTLKDILLVRTTKQKQQPDLIICITKWLEMA